MASRSTTATEAANVTKSENKAESGSRNKAERGSTKTASPSIWESRAIIKLIEAGSAAECPHCLDRVKFRARHRDQQVICNVYDNGVWKRVEQYHLECYHDADSPHGEATKG